jgi:putative heme-binding domain-containing protein
VLAAAVYSAGTTRDESAVGDLCELLTAGDTPPQIVRQVATSLGQFGDEAAVPAILERLHSDADRVLEHALIYALIEIADRDATAKGLASESPRVRRAALIALDQMPAGDLARDEVAALLDTTDQPLLTAALDVISRREGWANELVSLSTKMLAQPQLSDSEQSLLSGALVGLAKDEKIQALLATRLAAADAPIATKLLLLDVISRSDLVPFPPVWIEPVKKLLERPDDELTYAAVGAVAGSEAFDGSLQVLARNDKCQLDTRIAAFSSIIPRNSELSRADFTFLYEVITKDVASSTRAAAARVLSAAKLTDSQRTQLFEAFLQAGPIEITALLPAFENVTDPKLLSKMAPKLIGTVSSVPTPLLDRLKDHLPDELRDDVLLALEIHQLKLANIERDLPTGGVESGKLVFHGRKAACAACHRVGSEGGKIGPDLSKVGERRNERDLLEAVIVPSASIARGYESQTIRTTDGRTLTGLVVRETTESIYLRTNDQREIRLRRKDIDEQRPSDVSIMPAGLENTMTRQELADLLAYLRSLK